MSMIGELFFQKTLLHESLAERLRHGITIGGCIANVCEDLCEGLGVVEVDETLVCGIGFCLLIVAIDAFRGVSMVDFVVTDGRDR